MLRSILSSIASALKAIGSFGAFVWDTAVAVVQAPFRMIFGGGGSGIEPPQSAYQEAEQEAGAEQEQGREQGPKTQPDAATLVWRFCKDSVYGRDEKAKKHLEALQHVNLDAARRLAVADKRQIAELYEAKVTGIKPILAGHAAWPECEEILKEIAEKGYVDPEPGRKTRRSRGQEAEPTAAYAPGV